MNRRSMRHTFANAGFRMVAAFVVIGTMHPSSATDSNRSSTHSRRVVVDHAREIRPSASAADADRKLIVPRPPVDETRPAAGSDQRNPVRSQTAPTSDSKRPPKSVIAQAAYGEVLSEPIPPSLQPAMPFGHSMSCDGCGDCRACDACPSCGIEAACGIEANCGVEGYTCGAPGCVNCGSYAEPGCGIGSAIGTCNPTRGLECIPLCLPILSIDWCRFEFFAGVHGFTGPPNFPTGLGADDRVGTGSFGFHQGLNEGRSLEPWLGVDWGAQLGVRTTQNNFNGSAFTDDDRNQVFLTGGFFRRVDYGLQMGVVYDYLNDDWYYHTDLTQLRGELSWKFGGCHEMGYRFMAGTGSSSSDTTLIAADGGLVNGSIALEATDQHRIFYRRDLGGDGLLDTFIGTTDDEDTLFGASVDTPLRGRLGLRTGFAYLNPAGPDGLTGNRNESWNVSLSIVWRPCGPTGKCDGYYKPLFDVADNGSFMVDHR